MAYEIINTDHRLTLEQREHLVISGVEEVERFDEESIVLTTNMGELEIRGEGLHIEKLSLEGGELHVEGTVTALIYGMEPRESGGLLRRLLGG
jgi:sporulation protein YabP